MQTAALSVFSCVASRNKRGPSSPAPGYRNYASGEPGGVGNNGNSWSSAVSGIDGRFLWFNSQDLSPSRAHNRGHGLQLRCLSEEKGWARGGKGLELP
ncbi:hypothetical protein [uncultured Rikenella sp.]|uniref:hypothetical protein n=1 Tax=uncultured Rikenella sp. TaxID=368003 RepID=UPI0025CF1C86|nr:hypothetical protein [uncultured Rikenella sp.]